MQEVDVELKVGAIDLQGLVDYLNVIARENPVNLSRVSSICEYAEKLLGNGIVITAECGGKRIGMLAGYYNDQAGGAAFVSQFHVVADARRHHVGRRLMDCAVRLARSRGLESMRLKVHVGNDVAKRFYANCGFVLVASDGVDEEMVKSL